MMATPLKLQNDISASTAGETSKCLEGERARERETSGGHRSSEEEMRWKSYGGKKDTYLWMLQLSRKDISTTPRDWNLEDRR